MYMGDRVRLTVKVVGTSTTKHRFRKHNCTRLLSLNACVVCSSGAITRPSLGSLSLSPSLFRFRFLLFLFLSPSPPLFPFLFLFLFLSPTLSLCLFATYTACARACCARRVARSPEYLLYCCRVPGSTKSDFTVDVVGCKGEERTQKREQGSHCVRGAEKGVALYTRQQALNNAGSHLDTDHLVTGDGARTPILYLFVSLTRPLPVAPSRAVMPSCPCLYVLVNDTSALLWSVFSPRFSAR